MPDKESRDVSIHGNLINLNKARAQTNLDIEFGGENIREKLLDLAKSKAPDPEIFDTHDPYFYFAEASNDLVNCYYLSFQKPMLESWVDSLKDGVQFQLHHNNSAPIGHSIYGWQENKDGRERIIGAFYAIPGVQLNEYMSNDSFIAGIKSGTLRDVSVGMFVEECECSICGGDPMDWWGKWMGTCDCEHWLGEEYPITDINEKETGEKVVCTGLVRSGQLNEVSTVFAGGAPMAGIVPAMQLSRSQGLLDPRLQDRLERRFGISGVGTDSVATFTPGFKPAWMSEEELRVIRSRAVSVPVKENDVAKENEATTATIEVKLADMLTDNQLDRLKELGIETSDEEGNFNLFVMMESMTNKLAETMDSLESVEADAKIGRAYKAEKIADTIAAGIRANGNEWDAAGYQKMLEGVTIDQVKMLLNDLTKQGDAKFATKEGNPTRLTGDGESNDEATVEAENKKFNDRRYQSK